MTTTLRSFDPADTDAVIALWHEAGLTRPWNDPRKDIERKLRVQPELFRVAVDTAGSVVATAMSGYDGHRGWVYYVAVAESQRGTGLGARMMADAAELLEAMGCPKITVQVREGNDRVIGFYEHLGFAPDHALGLGRRLIED